MHNRNSKLNRSSGFTLMEALIALLLTGIISTAVFKTYLTQHQHYIAQDDITNIQQNGRAAIDEMTRQIRMAGFQLPTGLNALRAANTNPDSLVLIYRSDTAQAVLSANMASAAADIVSTTSTGGFTSGDWAYIFEPDSGGGEFFVISGVNPGAKLISHTPMTKAYRKDAIVLIVTWAQYYIDGSNSDHPNLMVRTPAYGSQVFAEDVSNLQFRFRLNNGTIVDVPPLVEDVREVLVNVTARSRNQDPYHTGSDPYKYRTYTSSVNVRNLGA
jgi:type II secretory pathway pseudopilin PulG